LGAVLLVHPHVPIRDELNRLQPGSSREKQQQQKNAPTWHMAQIGNSSTFQRIAAALKAAFFSPSGCPSRTLRTALSPDPASLPQPSCSHLVQPHSSLAYVHGYCGQQRLNASQAEAVLAVARAFGAPPSREHATVQLVQGPPGTGKTKTICEPLVVKSSSAMPLTHASLALPHRHRDLLPGL
jgi:hypothetical protein